ncbi:diguanylate cyclase [Baekduia soli]|uniref:Diguanylate cyclase n=1 Tax=Baekduia soli TaxID=496014 RepID=A0A5B8U6W6_9ACTN|nr:diguanylate cyclase [Baekduia soli]QEC48823.1 diguanylate cyclase [Baekduia soli]
MAPRSMQELVRVRMRSVVVASPDHYALLDRRLISRLAGVLYCCAGAIAIGLLALNPPTHAMGAAGWVPAVAILALAFVLGAVMVLTRRLLGPGALFLVGLSGPLMLAALQWLAGSHGAYSQLLILSVVWCGVTLPGPQVLVLLVLDTAIVFLPGMTEHGYSARVAECVATVGVMWTLALACVGYSDRLREIRRRLREQRDTADALARIDALTGLGNRRALDEALTVQVALVARTGHALSALVGDLDRFKRINDVHGHHAGDRLLCDVAEVLRDVVRTPDACFRWGGDEFVVLLTGADASEARDVAARVAAAVHARCTAPGGEPVTLSVGAATHAVGRSGAELLAAADADLLERKPLARSPVPDARS